MSKPSSKDVARLAGVSIATVSHVLNKTRFVSDDTERKVLDAVKTLNYRPNALARGLVTNISKKIGLVISEISNPFFAAAVRGIEDEILTHRYNIILSNTDENPEREEDCLQLLGSQQIDGLIIAPTGVRNDTLLSLAQSGLPIVQFDRRSPDLSAPLIRVNNEDGAYQAIRYLISLGHQRIACLINFDVISTQRDRLMGWERAMRDANLQPDNDLVVRADPHFYGIQSDSQHSRPIVRPPSDRSTTQSAYEVLQTLLRSPQRPSAIFVTSNQLMIGTLYAIRECGLVCPDDISLISFDDHDWAPLFSPPLTVVAQPSYRVGQTAAQLLMKMINGETVDEPAPQQVELIVRASCAAPANAQPPAPDRSSPYSEPASGKGVI
jgi:LacI family transcriptional regulator